MASSDPEGSSLPTTSPAGVDPDGTLDLRERLSADPIDLRSRWKLEIAVPGTDLHDEALELEAAVFGEYFHNSREDLETAYRPYEDAMEISVVRDPDGDVVGAARHGWSTANLVSLSISDLQRAPFDLDPSELLARSGPWDRFLDILTISVSPAASGGDFPLVSATLVAAGYYQAVRRGLTWLVTILDDFVLQYFEAVFGVPWRPIDGAVPVPYMGSPGSIPCEFGVGEAAAYLLEGPLRDLVIGKGDALGVEISSAYKVATDRTAPVVP